MKWSVIIPHSMDYPHVWFSVQDKFLRLDDYPINDYEVIIVENGSTGEHLRLVRLLGGKKGDNPDEWNSEENSWMAPRRRNLTYIEPKQVLHHTREDSPTQLHSKPACNMGAWRARGELLVFCDSHVLLNDNWFEMAEKYMDEHSECTILHSSLSWHNRHPVDGRRGYQYNLTFNKSGGRIWGNWSALKASDKPYMVAASGWASVVVRRDAYINKYKGFPSMLRSYGGGEPYMDILAWMMGDEVHVHPDMHTVHFSLTRSRGYHQGGPIIMMRNIALISYILGGEEWSHQVLDRALGKDKAKHPDWAKKYEEAYAQAVSWGRMRRSYVEKHAKYTLEEVLDLFKRRGVIH